MLRIVTEQHGEAYTIALHGRLAGDWVGLLARYWRSIVDSVPSARVTTVLSDVSFIDADGEALLDWMCRSGAELVATGCLNRHVVERIRSSAGRDNAGRAAPREDGAGVPARRARRARPQES
jgi:hypothetical protein